MTAEILLMNQNAVAMASDSAATISGLGTQNIRNHAIKLFSLSKYAPVGVMIYNDASLLMYPWETLIKEFRRELGKTTFNHIPEYMDNFVEWLEQNDFLKDKKIQEEFFKSATHLRFHEIFNTAFERFYRGEYDERSPNDIVIKILEEQTKMLSAKPYCRKFNKNDEKRLLKEYEKVIRIILNTVTNEQKYPENLNEKIKKLFVRYAILPITRDEFRKHYTGIIISGFGESDLFPSYGHIKVGRVFDSKLRIKIEEKNGINIESRVIIKPFAQTDVVDTITSGIAPDIKDSLGEILFRPYPKIGAGLVKG